MIHADQSKLDGWQTTRVSGSYLGEQKGKQPRTIFLKFLSLSSFTSFSLLRFLFFSLFSSVEIFTLKSVLYISHICLIRTALALIACIFYQGHRNSFHPVINLLLHFPGTSTFPSNPHMITSSSRSYLPYLLNSPWPKQDVLDSHPAYFHYALLNSVSYYRNCKLNANKGFSEKVMLSLDKRDCLRSCWLGLKKKFQAERIQCTVANSFLSIFRTLHFGAKGRMHLGRWEKMRQR